MHFIELVCVTQSAKLQTSRWQDAKLRLAILWGSFALALYLASRWALFGFGPSRTVRPKCGADFDSIQSFARGRRKQAKDQRARLHRD